MIGFVNIYKPEGVSSFSIVSKVKKAFNIKKVGHLGTLDPMAEGVLPIAIGRATKLFDYFLNKDKVYIAVFEFGYGTDTLDKTGEKINFSDKIPTSDEIINVLPQFIGKQNQLPPNYSAKKINGVRAYQLARNGVEFETKPKEITIFDIEIIEQCSQTSYKFRIHCSSGTYIRSIGRDIAEKLGTFATMTSLIRTRSGTFSIENSISAEDISEQSIIKIEDALNIDKVYINDTCYDKLTNGNEVYFNEDFEQKIVFCKGENIGIGHCRNNKLKLDIIFSERL